MSLRKNLADLEENGQLGDWCFTLNDENIFFRYPTTDPFFEHGNAIGHVPVCKESNIPGKWQWDGNREAPTLSPSINIIGHWHGYLRAGKFETV